MTNIGVSIMRNTSYTQFLSEAFLWLTTCTLTTDSLLATFYWLFYVGGPFYSSFQRFSLMQRVYQEEHVSSSFILFSAFCRRGAKFSFQDFCALMIDLSSFFWQRRGYILL
ncbi:hypothetical protein O6H91_13G075200 [Diphasiastrum complanatum]|uniref:Uncharacterized protein n=1 Tax=Diphasiastrum complanatum TaxID=34168 RepID=A0ACC2BWB8_DIPCM|nr:hypothetical protein O6H91_13G075200 [Diphasiastrum complanatum]